MSNGNSDWGKHSEFVREQYGIGAEWEICWMGIDIDALPDGPEELEVDVGFLGPHEAIEKHLQLFKAPAGWLLCGLYNSDTESWFMAMIRSEDYQRINDEEKGAA